jgi:hypothetical protein
MGLKINHHHQQSVPIETENNAPGVSSTQIQKESQSLGIGGTADGFELAKQRGAFNVDGQKYQGSADDSYSVSELRTLVSAAKAENKSPFSIANLNRLLAANSDKYIEIAADLKGWINKNLHLTSRQKAPLDGMSQEDLQKVMDSAKSATELGKRIAVEIENQPAEGAKVLKLRNEEIADQVKLRLGKVPQKIDEQKLNEVAHNAEH